MFVSSSAQSVRYYNVVRVCNGKVGSFAVVHKHLRLSKNRGCQPGSGPRKSNSLLHASQQQQSTVNAQVPDSACDTDTIAAVVTGAQQGSVAIIRLSGHDAVQIATTIFNPSSPEQAWTPKTHRIYHGHVVDGKGGIVDEVLLLCMLAPKSYTSEDVIELHCHGGGVCVQRVLGCCLKAGARLAKPGEFTLRAFLNGRLDLSQAESVNELVGARTAAAADSALAGLTGGIGAAVHSLRLSALTLLAELEAMIDFEEDVPARDMQRLQAKVRDIGSGVQRALDTASKGRLLKAGLQVALVGRPNVGKSSLLNAWSGTDRAIVTQVAGTTRDIVQADVVVGGVPVSLLDTAGMREASDVVERLGVERSQAAALAADIVVMVLDAEVGWTADDQVIFDHLWGRAVSGNKPGITAPSILVWNKVDLTASAASTPQMPSSQQHSQASAPAQSSTDDTPSDGNANLPLSSDMFDHAVTAAADNAFDSQSPTQQSFHSPTSTSVSHTSSSGQGSPAWCEDTCGPIDAQTHPQAQQQAYPAWSTAGSADTRPDTLNAETSAVTLPKQRPSGLVATAAAPAASATDRAGQVVSPSSSDPPAACGSASGSSSSSQFGSARQHDAVYGLPSSCAGSFAACVETCATSGLGLDALSAALLQLSDAPSLAAGGVEWAVNARQAEALIRAQEALVAVMDSVNEGLPIDFWTIDLRCAVSALGEISGDDVTEEVLDSIFSQFCIGK